MAKFPWQLGAVAALMLIVMLIIWSTSGGDIHIGIPTIQPRPTTNEVLDCGYTGPGNRRWVDIRKQGAQNDYCRLVGNAGAQYWACALSGITDPNDQYSHKMTEDELGLPFTEAADCVLAGPKSTPVRRFGL